jgi:hypothetical protein
VSQRIRTSASSRLARITHTEPSWASAKVGQARKARPCRDPRAPALPPGYRHDYAAGFTVASGRRPESHYQKLPVRRHQGQQAIRGASDAWIGHIGLFIFMTQVLPRRAELPALECGHPPLRARRAAQGYGATRLARDVTLRRSLRPEACRMGGTDGQASPV